jgi:hypothetical protein
MRISLRETLLAATALVSVALLVGCGESVVERRMKQLDAETRVYGTSPADAAATLAKLRTPAGFRPVACGPHGRSEYMTCFNRLPSILVDELEMKRLLAGIGAQPSTGMGPVQCHPRSRHFAVPHLQLQGCVANAIVGEERLAIFEKSLVLVGPSRTTGTARRLPSVRSGTEIEVDVIGHFLHTGIRAGEAP